MVIVAPLALINESAAKDNMTRLRTYKMIREFETGHIRIGVLKVNDHQLLVDVGG